MSKSATSSPLSCLSSLPHSRLGLAKHHSARKYNECVTWFALCLFSSPDVVNFFEILWQLEAALALDFSKYEARLQQPVNWDALEGVLWPKDYINKWRILLWDRVFLSLFATKASSKFTKGTELRKIDGGTKIINRCLYRYSS